MKKIKSFLTGDNTAARSVRSTGLTMFSFGAKMGLRLGSNLILTRLLVPEYFGLMALVQIAIMGLQQFSDVGLNDAVIRSKRGGDPDLLNTAWVVSICRGILLWFAVLMIAGPVAGFYEQPDLAILLPVAALSVIINGFRSTRIALSLRELTIARLTTVELAGQGTGIVVMVIAAWWTGSIWALVAGSLVGDLVGCLLSHILIPGEKNRFTWSKSAFWELFSFGKYIVFTSILGFIINNGDRAILGKFVSLSDLAVYNIAFMFAGTLMQLTRTLNSRVLMPLYSKAHREEKAGFHRKLGWGRFGLALAFMCLSLFLALIGNWMVVTLYTEPYHLAGPILTLLAVANMPFLAFSYYRSIFLGSDNPLYFAAQFTALAILQTLLLYFGISTYGLLGAIAAPGLTVLIVYPLTAWLAVRCKSWFPLQDAILALIFAASGWLILTLHADTVRILLP